MLSFMKNKLILLATASMLFSGCAHHPAGMTSLGELEQLGACPTKKNTDKIGAIRLQALQDVALSVGAQAGLASRAKSLDEVIEQKSAQLTQVFNFSGLMLDHNILPPVLAEGRETLNLASDDSIRLADRVYKIITQARFVTTAPNWREYLILNYPIPEAPNSTLLPVNRQEKVVWDKYIQQGWKDGTLQANTIFNSNLARLKRDYNGMILYRKLLAQHIVSPPFVAKTDLGITGDSSNMRIHDQVLRITSMPSLQQNAKNWEPGIHND
jgi:defect-in-organelle-trafficking protein DotC